MSLSPYLDCLPATAQKPVLKLVSARHIKMKENLETQLPAKQLKAEVGNVRINLEPR